MSDFIIDARDVHKAYGATKALDGVDLQVPPGTVLGVLGPNGAGKTTLVRVLATLLKPDSGSATVAGLNVVTQAQEVRQVIGLAGQYAAVDEADELAVKIVVIDRGKVIAKGTADELKTQLGGDVLDVKVHHATDLARASELLSTVGNSKPQTDASESRVRVAVGEGQAVDVLLAAVRALDESGIVLDDIGIHKPSLDDVFLSLTGRDTRIDEPDPNATSTGRRSRPGK